MPKTLARSSRPILQQLQTTYGTTYLVADSALYSEDNLQKLAETHMQVDHPRPGDLERSPSRPGPGRSAGHGRRCTEGYRYHELTSTYGGVAQRWVLIYSEPRQPQAQRTVDKQLRQAE